MQSEYIRRDSLQRSLQWDGSSTAALHSLTWTPGSRDDGKLLLPSSLFYHPVRLVLGRAFRSRDFKYVLAVSDHHPTHLLHDRMYCYSSYIILVADPKRYSRYSSAGRRARSTLHNFSSKHRRRRHCSKHYGEGLPVDSCQNALAKNLTDDGPQSLRHSTSRSAAIANPVSGCCLNLRYRRHAYAAHLRRQWLGSHQSQPCDVLFPF